jgi:hypothetical protein
VRLHFLSDLHVEFAPFVPDPAAVDMADVIVLASDIHQGARGMAWVRQAFAGKRIIYVAGNREFYKHHWDAHLALLREQAAMYGIDFLENDVVTIEGIRFLGTTLWTEFEYFGASRRSQNMRQAENVLNDFRLIEVDPSPRQCALRPDPGSRAQGPRPAAHAPAHAGASAAEPGLAAGRAAQGRPLQGGGGHATLPQPALMRTTMGQRPDHGHLWLEAAQRRAAGRCHLDL